MIKHLFTVLILLASSSLYSQDKDNVLMTIDDKEVTVGEFLNIYEKNLEIVQDEGQKQIDNYLDLFIDYNLKVSEAYAQNLDKDPEYIKEFSKHQQQLSENYLYSKDVTEELIKEAYDRLNEEINANHILILHEEGDTPQDTLAKYNKLKNIRERALNGEDFETLAKEYSEEPNAENTAGSLGYFKGFSMVYSFENAAYNTPVGGISEIVKTRFGYHIIKVNDRRPTPNEVTAAHIMVSTKKEGVTEEQAKKRIDEIYQRIQQGESFDDLITLSDDEPTAKRDGIIGRFGSGRLNAPEFEATAFALENPGDVSKPVQTSFGWHIIKLIERHPKETFEEMRPSLEKRIKQGNRNEIVKNTVNQQIKDKYGFEKNSETLAFFNQFVTDSVLKRKWEYDPNYSKLKNVVFSIGDRDYTYGDFAAYIKKNQKRGRLRKDVKAQVSMYYEDFEDDMIQEFYMYKLEEENEEYSAIINEYRNGLLIYDLMEKNIWEPTKTDTIGLENYFNNHRDDYVWKKRIDAVVASVSDPEKAVKVQQMLKEGANEKAIKEALNTEDQVDVIFTADLFEMDHQALPKGFEANKGVSKIYTEPSGSSTVVLVKEVLEAHHKTLDQVRGKVMADYQNHLEQKWMEELRKKYNVKVNKRVLKKLKKKFA